MYGERRNVSFSGYCGSVDGSKRGIGTFLLINHGWKQLRAVQSCMDALALCSRNCIRQGWWAREESGSAASPLPPTAPSLPAKITGLGWSPSLDSLPSHEFSVQPCLDFSDLCAYSPFVKMGLTRLSKLLWNIGTKLLSECAKQRYCISSDLSVWNFAKGRGKEATVESSSAQRSCKQMVFAYRICCSGATLLQRSSFLIISGGLNSGYIWNS